MKTGESNWSFRPCIARVAVCAACRRARGKLMDLRNVVRADVHAKAPMPVGTIWASHLAKVAFWRKGGRRHTERSAS